MPQQQPSTPASPTGQAAAPQATGQQPCKQCGTPCPSGICSPACRKARYAAHLAARKQQRKQARAAASRVCKQCPKVFIPKRKTHENCSEECAAKSLKQAVARQRERRAKEVKKSRTTAAEGPEQVVPGSKSPSRGE